MKKDKKVLFLIKKRSNYGISYGLKNSCVFLANALKNLKIESRIEEVIDGNCIDRVVTEYDPTHVFIEAFWVTPEKFKELFDIKRHAERNWYVRIHSKIPFLTYEGIAFKWMKEYYQLLNDKNFNICANSLDLVYDLNKSIDLKCLYAPNIYDAPQAKNPIKQEKGYIHIGCFGCIRPFKNQLKQAIAALIFAKDLKKKIAFHINTSRFETGGESTVKNLRYLFNETPHKLIEHEWSNHEEFLNLISSMDLCTQVSFSETFNIVSADSVNNGVPTVGSNEIEWMSDLYQADPNSVRSISNKLYFAYSAKFLNTHWLNKLGLKKYSKSALEAWKNILDIK